MMMLSQLLPKTSTPLSQRPAQALGFGVKQTTPQPVRFGNEAALENETPVKQFFEAIFRKNIPAIRGFIDGPIARGELSINVPREQKATPLWQAVMTKKPEIVEMILAAGGDPKIPDNIGHTPLHMAVMHSTPEIVQVLIDAKAPLNAQDKYDGFTPLHLAAEGQKPGIAMLLMKAGADPLIASKKGKLPFQLAVEDRHYDVAKLLLQAQGEFPTDVVMSPEEEQNYLNNLVIQIPKPPSQLQQRFEKAMKTIKRLIKRYARR